MYIFNLLLFVLAVGLKTAQDMEDWSSLTTSTAGLEQLLETENFLIHNLDNYAEELERKLIVIRSLIISLREENEKARKNPEYYISIPTNLFALVRRLQKDWVYLDAYMAKTVGEAQIKILHEHKMNLPNEADFDEAVMGITRLQDTYDLKAEDLARGVINGKQYDTKLTALDCYSLGYELLRQENYINAGYWLFTAIGSHEENNLAELHDLSYSKILELYSEILLKQGRYQDSLIVLNAILSLPSLTLSDLQVVQKKNAPERHIQIYIPEPVQVIKKPNQYQRVCRGEFSSRISTLYCLYNTTNTAFLKLAPLKMEIISLDPYLILFHDVMSDEEITTLQKMSRPILERAKVYDETREHNMTSPFRTANTAWFPNSTNAITARINRRIEDMTGFNLTDSEDLHAINYGLGGHYESHYDFFDVSWVKNTNVVAQQGDRKATVILYMTDVDQGGATVFPNIDIAVFPKKGTALVWYNLNNRYEGDYRTLHSGCPVLVGSKWVMTKWIRERNQVFRLPCYDT